jgi:hypothetical protein
MTVVEDMSPTGKPFHHKGFRQTDQENYDYADVRVMPT